MRRGSRGDLQQFTVTRCCAATHNCPPPPIVIAAGSDPATLHTGNNRLRWQMDTSRNRGCTGVAGRSPRTVAHSATAPSGSPLSFVTQIKVNNTPRSTVMTRRSHPLRGLGDNPTATVSALVDSTICNRSATTVAHLVRMEVNVMPSGTCSLGERWMSGAAMKEFA